jgi:hypothetical protein
MMPVIAAPQIPHHATRQTPLAGGLNHIRALFRRGTARFGTGGGWR